MLVEDSLHFLVDKRLRDIDVDFLQGGNADVIGFEMAKQFVSVS
jgi:hypothetical protein